MITQEEYESLPESVKGSFIEEGEGFSIKTEDNSGLKTALQKERQRASEFEKVAKKVEGIDLDELLQLKAKAEQADHEEKKAEGKFDQILSAKEQEWQKELEKERGQRLEYEKQLVENHRNSVAMSILSSQKVIPERLSDAQRLIADDIIVERVDGKMVVKFMDDTGYASEGKPEDFGAKWAEKHDFYFKPDGRGGSNDRNNLHLNGDAGKQMARSEWNALSMDAQAKFMESGGELKN